MPANPRKVIAKRRGAARSPTPARSAAVGKTSSSTPAWRRVSTAAATTPTRSSWLRRVGATSVSAATQQTSDEQRVEDRLGHQEAAVGEGGEGERQRGHEHRGPLRDDRARPEVGGHGGERHADRAERLRDLVAALRREPGERPADQRRIDEAVEVAVRVLDRQPAAVVERPPDDAVDHLVGRDPRRRDVPPEQDPAEHRHGHQAGNDESGETAPRTPAAQIALHPREPTMPRRGA